MRKRIALARLSQGERGFTLPEVLVAMVMMLTVMFALYSIFDMSLRVFSYGNDKVEAVENARAGLGKVEREVRSAYPQGEAPSALLTTWESNRISFGNDLNGDGSISCPNPEGENERISYEVYETDTTQALGRSKCDENNESVAEYIEDVSGDGQALTFEYFEDDGTKVVPGGDESGISIVRITLEVEKQGQQDAEQVLTTDVHLRNRDGDAQTRTR